MLYKHVSNIDEPFRFNASLRYTLVTLVLIANTFSTFISLSFLTVACLVDATTEQDATTLSLT